VRIPGVDLHDASVRRLPVGEDDEAITGELGLEVRVDAGHHGLDGSGGCEVLNEHLGPGPAVLHVEDDVPAILRHPGAHPRARRVKPPPNTSGSWLVDRAEAVVVNADAGLTALERVVEAAAVRLEGQRPVEGSGRTSGRSLRVFTSRTRSSGLVFAPAPHP